MAIRQQLEQLVNENNGPCVTISLNTHRTKPDNAKDGIMLKNLLKEARERVIADYGKRSAATLLEKIATLDDGFDHSQNLDSLHIFLSSETREIIRTAWPVSRDAVHLSDKFTVRPLIKAYNRSENYLIMLLSQSGVSLYEVLNDSIISEITEAGFPFDETPHYLTESVRRSDPKQMDNMVREFLNKVDKSLVKIHNQTGLSCVVVSTPDNFSRLMQVADKPAAYIGHAPVNYNQTKPHTIARQGYEIIQTLQQKRRLKSIEEMKEAVAQDRVITDLQNIYRAALDGRGELLIVHQDHAQAVVMQDERSFSLADKPSGPGVIDDIISVIAWEVQSKKGRVVFTQQDQVKDLGKIALKTRY
jgi:hypothetical protein